MLSELLCPSHRGQSWSHQSRSCATLRRAQSEAKAALSNRGGLEQRGKQHTHYKGRDTLKHNSEPAHLGSSAWLIGVGQCRNSRKSGL